MEEVNPEDARGMGQQVDVEQTPERGQARFKYIQPKSLYLSQSAPRPPTPAEACQSRQLRKDANVNRDQRTRGGLPIQTILDQDNGGLGGEA